MNQSNSSKQVLLSVIGVAILVVAVVGVSFAFFNYTRSGQENTVQTGKIWFNSTQAGALSIANFFPQRPNSSDTANTSSTYVTIQGGTNYQHGLVYSLRAVDVKSNGAAYNPTAQGNVPILIDVALDDQAGTVNDTTHGTFTPAGTGTGIQLVEGASLGSGTIKYQANPTATDVNGKIKITAYIDADVAITDTLVGDADEPSGYQNGTTTDWVNGRKRLTTAQWNELADHPVSFRVQVVSSEAPAA